MLAARRTDRVIGRIKFLTASIKTINGEMIIGEFWGTKWAKETLVLIVQLIKISPTQIGMAIDRENVKCLEIVNT